jgi:hypothetical protein
MCAVFLSIRLTLSSSVFLLYLIDHKILYLISSILNLPHLSQVLSFSLGHVFVRRSQWPRGLRHELSSPARALGSWVRIPLKAWMSAFILCLCCPVQVEALRRADPRPGSFTDCPMIKKLKWNEAVHGCPMFQSGSNRKERKIWIRTFLNSVDCDGKMYVRFRIRRS